MQIICTIYVYDNKDIYIILMRKRRKLVKSHESDCDKTAQIFHLEELICDSHTQEKLHDEEIAVTKINTN